MLGKNIGDRGGEKGPLNPNQANISFNIMKCGSESNLIQLAQMNKHTQIRIRLVKVVKIPSGSNSTTHSLRGYTENILMKSNCVSGSGGSGQRIPDYRPTAPHQVSRA